VVNNNEPVLFLPRAISRLRRAVNIATGGLHFEMGVSPPTQDTGFSSNDSPAVGATRVRSAHLELVEGWNDLSSRDPE